MGGEITAVASAVGKGWGDGGGLVARRAGEDVLGGVDGAVDVAVGCPEGGFSLVSCFLCDEGFFHSGFLFEGGRVDGFGADFDDAVFRAGFGLDGVVIVVCFGVGGIAGAG